uniref:DTHCT domain-containing protein n=1 Tax=Aegilops tauschii subsp. strangulata TaxID=200361 RepID=A0A453TDM8_AEGTS
ADSEDSDVKDESGTQTTSDTPVRKSARTAGKTFKFAELAGGDSAESDTEIEFAEDLDEKMESAEIKEEIPGEDIKEEIPSEDIKPEDPPAESLSIKKQPLVQANLSAMFKKAEEKKRPTTTRSPKGSPATKGPAAKKQRATPTKKQSPAKKEASGSQKKQKAKVEEDEIEELSDDPSQDDDAAPAKKQRGTPKGKQSAAKKED